MYGSFAIAHELVLLIVVLTDVPDLPTPLRQPPSPTHSGRSAYESRGVDRASGTIRLSDYWLSTALHFAHAYRIASSSATRRPNQFSRGYALFFRPVPSANTVVRWVNETAFVAIVPTRPCPTFGRPVHRRGRPHRLRPGTSPHAFRIPPHGGHPALQRPTSGGFRSPLAVSGFRLRARVGISIPSHSLRPARRYPRFRIRRPSSERRRDFNPPEQRTARHTLWPLLTSCAAIRRSGAWAFQP